MGFVPGVTLTRWRRTWAERYPRDPLEVVAVPQPQQEVALDEAWVAACFVRLPVSAQDRHLIPLWIEAPVVVVPRDHPVSLYPEVDLADLDGEIRLDPNDADVWDQVAGGAGVVVLPQSVARAASRRDLVHCFVRDAEPTRIALVWSRASEHPSLQDFVGVVRGRTVNSSRSPPPPGPPPDRPARKRPGRPRV